MKTGSRAADARGHHGAAALAGCRTLQRKRRTGSLALIIPSILAASAAAEPEAAPGALDEVIVTAQKRAESLQTVPVSVETLDSRRLEELRVTSFDQYIRFLPSLSAQSFGPGQSELTVRGVTNGTVGLRVGSQPLVGVYLDELPETTIGNNLDMHIYDIARVEALSGPQGTLYGSSSMAGTLRIITNKPSTTGFAAAYDVTADTYTGHASGGKVEGFVNVPLSPSAAIRLVGYAQHDGGFINNTVAPPEYYPTSGAPHVNNSIARNNFNPVDTTGGRAALKIDINDRWTVTPTLYIQRQSAEGIAAYEPSVGDLATHRYMQEYNHDNWWQAALTVEGKIFDLEALYVTGYLRRVVESAYDYSSYTYFYDVYYSMTAYPTYYGDNFRNNAGQLISPAMANFQTDHYSKQSHELRLSTPDTWRLRGVIGAFYERQSDTFRNENFIAGLADQYSITNEPGVWFLNSMVRTDRDRALFTDWSYSLTKQLVLTGGIREFGYDNTVYGFFGFPGGPTYDGFTFQSGEALCIPGTQTTGTQWPCIDVDRRATHTGSTHRVNLAYHFDPARMLYATWSTGFRPGGVNRVVTRPPYSPDSLTNFEVGWKTEWLDHRLRLNGALFFERWANAQFSLFGANNLTEITNAGRAEIRGIEADVAWRQSTHLTLSGALTVLNAHVVTNFCRYPSPSLTCTEPEIYTAPDGHTITLNNGVLAPTGTRLPVSARRKGDLIARYERSIGGYDTHVQVAAVGQSDVVPVLQVAYAQPLGNQPGYVTGDLTAGIARGRWHLEGFVQNMFDHRGEALRTSLCLPALCLVRNIAPIAPRLVGVEFGQQF